MLLAPDLAFGIASSIRAYRGLQGVWDLIYVHHFEKR